MRRICVYCGSNPGTRPVYRQAAEELGRELAARHLELVYGGGSVGLMGALAAAVTDAEGEVISVMPSALFPREIAYVKGTRFYEVKSMHERKALMADLADGFIALPGGYGTYDELFEIITWAQLGLHSKPIGLLNIAGFFDPLLTLIAHTSDEGFISARHKELVLQQETPTSLLDALASYTPVPTGSKWTELPER